MRKLNGLGERYISEAFHAPPSGGKSQRLLWDDLRATLELSHVQ
jgi:hypothetical protein